MKASFLAVLFALPMVFFTGCNKEEENSKTVSLNDVQLQVSFGRDKAASVATVANAMTYETPENYYVALKKVALKGTQGSPDFVLFETNSLSTSLVFDFTDTETVHSLLTGTQIPEGEYNGVELEIYYLQMNIALATTDRGVEWRNVRIYLSDDAETEDGLHQPGDMTQINEGQEIGWLLGEGQVPNMDPVSPRSAAYTQNGDGSTWYDFAGKSGEIYGPFGDVEFMNTASHPVYRTTVDFTLVDNGGTTLILDFNVNHCWQFDDKSGDGVFGASDLDPLDPTRWNMALPVMTVTLQ